MSKYIFGKGDFGVWWVPEYPQWSLWHRDCYCKCKWILLGPLHFEFKSGVCSENFMDDEEHDEKDN